MSPLFTYILIAIGVYMAIVLIKPFRIILIVVLGIIYIPINTVYMKVQKWHFHMKKEDPIVFYLFTPFYWLLVGLTYAVSAPYEFISSKGIH